MIDEAEPCSVTFKKEKITMITILVFFDFSYALRALWDNYLLFETQNILLSTLSAILTPILVDILPVSLVMMFHARNLNSTVPRYQESASEMTVS